MQDGRFLDRLVRVGGGRRDRVRRVVLTEEGRVGARDRDPREGVEARVAAVEADCVCALSGQPRERLSGLSLCALAKSEARLGEF